MENSEKHPTQGSVLAPMLFNVYTNNQPICDRTKHFIYADDFELTARRTTVVNSLAKTLEEMTRYYYISRLKPNPPKTQVCVSTYEIEMRKGSLFIYLFELIYHPMKWRRPETLITPSTLEFTLTVVQRIKQK